jgi:hypothetical protein
MICITQNVEIFWYRQKIWQLKEKADLNLIIPEETGLLDAKKQIGQLVRDH